ncbi:MAG: sensor histidine kinase [Megasphaera sp.]|uniref:sensor histidine kinase n=1 Tax=Megasphaera sp. TaxID=2023260 RepID=UPI003F026197
MRQRRLSLKIKAGLYIGCFTIFFILGLMAAVGFGFDRYYYYAKKEAMVEASQKISELYRQGGGVNESEFDTLSQRYAMDVLIVDHGKLVYSSRPDRRVHLPPKVFPQDEKTDLVVSGQEDADPSPGLDFKIPVHIQELLDLMNGKEPSAETLGVVSLSKNVPDFEHFNLVDRIQDDAYVILSQSVAPMKESISVVQHFIILCGLIWLVIAVIGTVFLTKRMVKPLLELKNLAVAMAHLDFSKKWKGNWNDEIGELGDSINTLSNQLNVALTALQQSNTELQKQLDKAKEVEHMRKSFLSAVSHELKTPLAIIQGYAEGLDTLDIDEATQRRYCSVIRSETQKMDKLVKDLLNLSRLETGSFKLEETVFDFTALVADSQDRFAKAIADKGIHVEWNFPAEMNVYGDPERISTVLTNFMSNAIDYTAKGKHIRVFAENLGERYRISVYNEGSHIEEKYQQRIWEPFYKIDSSRARSPQRIFGGHGLGLGTVAALVKLHGETYGVRNEPDGVTFWFTIKKADRSS